MGGALTLCKRRNDGGSLADLGIMADGYTWDGLPDDRIEAYYDAKDKMIEDLRTAEVDLGPDEEKWVDQLDKDQNSRIKMLLMRRAISLVHVLMPIEEERQGINKLHQKGFVSAERWAGYEHAEKLCADELRSVREEAQVLGLGSQPNIIHTAVSFYRAHGVDWPNGPDASSMETPEHPCPPEFPLGCRVKLIVAEGEPQNGAVGLVASGVADDPSQVKVKFPKGLQVHSIDELQKLEGPVESTTSAPKPFELGQKVRWMSADEDIEEGEIGEVVGGRTNGHVRIKFAKGTWAFPPQELLNPDGSPTVKREGPKPHPDAKEPPKMVLKVNLTVEVGESLGFVLDTSLENCLLIKSLVASGSAQTYNSTQADPVQRIQVGDRIAAVVNVSGNQKPIAGDSKLMLEAITAERTASTNFLFIMERILGPPLRYKLGQRVKANCGDRGWKNGSVVDVWAKGKPYVISIENTEDSSGIVVAPADSDNCVIKGDARFKVGDEIMARRETGYDKGEVTEVLDHKCNTGYRIRVLSDNAQLVAPEDRNRFVCPIARFAMGDKVLAKVGDGDDSDGYQTGTIKAVYHAEWIYAIELGDGSVVTAPQDTDYYVKAS